MTLRRRTNKMAGEMKRQYPVLLNLVGQQCVVVGGGNVAERKARALVDCGAAVRVVAPAVCRGLRALARAAPVEIRKRPYEETDLSDAVLVIAATDDAKVNEVVWRDAMRARVLVNVADDPPHCTFTLPATVHRDPVLFAVSTGGTSPALARALRQHLEESYPEAFGRFAVWLGEIRERLRALVPDLRQRETLWQKAVDANVVELVRRGEEAAAKRTVLAALYPFLRAEEGGAEPTSGMPRVREEGSP